MLFIAIQFYQSALNINKEQVYTTDFTLTYNTPVEVKTILKTQKKDLNFNEWGLYASRK